MKKVRNILLIALIALTVMSMYSVSGTYAKYTSTVNGTSDVARVALWDFQIKDGDTPVTEGYEFKLFDMSKVYDLDTNNELTANLETDMKTDGDVIVAPGTGGYVDLEIKNAGEVNAEYTVLANLSDASGIPLEFKAVTYDDNTSTIPTAANIGPWVKAADFSNVSWTSDLAMGKTKVIRVYWRWAFENAHDASDTLKNNDQYDTDLATLTGSQTVADLETIQMSVKFTATQKN